MGTLARPRAFVAPIGDLTEADLATPGTWSRRIVRKFGGVECLVIGLDDLIVNKQAAGRPQDLADAIVLAQIRAAETGG